jgi:hypothetical protein
MARIRTDQPNTQVDAPQSTIVDRLRRGNAVPILSSTIANDFALGGHDTLVQAYADYNRYPLPERSLAQVMQFKAITDPKIRDALTLREDYLLFIKSRLFELAEKAGAKREALDGVDQAFDSLTLGQMCEQLSYPQVVVGNHPFALLANLKLPIYITTGCHSFIEDALRRAGRDPKSDYCRWNQKLVNLATVFDGKYDPSKEQPLVYHLYGWDAIPESMVVTEDDHFRFLMACAQDAGKSTDPVHDRVRRELSLSSLLLLGYRLRSDEFRSLFWGLIATRSDRKASVVSIHLQPSQVEKEYLEKYLQKDHNFEVSWGETSIYLQQLYAEMNA